MLGSIFNAWTIGSLLISLAIAYHVIRNGKSPMWLVAIALGAGPAPGRQCGERR
jgi:hypothetical protein